VLRANVVAMGHGESRGMRVLGSGNGEKARQSFRLDIADISHVADTTAATGVAPDIAVTVDGITWQRADSLDTTVEGRNAYSPVLQEDGTLRIDFRRRLPSGQDNVAIRGYRVGSGAKGNTIPPRSLSEPLRPHAAIERIHQPFTTSGGSDGEAASAMRRNAPAHLKALGRAVSLDDFAVLARRQPGIAQARAQMHATASWRDEVVVTVVPTGGAALENGSATAIAHSLMAKATPGVRVSIQPFDPVFVTISAVIGVDAKRYVPEEVQAAAEEALRHTFGLERRTLGQHLYAAEILAALEEVPGVENATAELRQPEAGWPTTGTKEGAPLRTVPPDAPQHTPLRAVIATANQVIHLRRPTEGDAGGSLAVTVREVRS
jgi:predicted phage baseplate assembly protein